MTARERVIKAINFDYPDRVPRDLWWLPAVEMIQEEELKNLLERIPMDVDTPKFKAGIGKKGNLQYLCLEESSTGFHASKGKIC